MSFKKPSSILNSATSALSVYL